MYCLDSNIIISFFRGDTIIKNRLMNINNLEINTSITPIVLAELYKGAFIAERSEEALSLIESFLNGVTFIDFNKEACMIFGRVYKKLKKKGKLTEEEDLMIASIAIAHNQILVTRNIKHFKNIPDLKLEVW